jgi:hypothetical protein
MKMRAVWNALQTSARRGTLAEGFAESQGGGGRLGRIVIDRQHGFEALDQVTPAKAPEALVDQPEELPLFEGGSRQDRDVGGGAVPDRFEGVLGNHVSIHHGEEHHQASQIGHPPHGLSLGLEDPVDRDPGECLVGGGRAAEILQEPRGHLFGKLGLDHVIRRAAHADGAVEEAPRPGRAEQGRDAHGPGGLTEEGDVLGIAAEAIDVFVHPLERSDLVAHAEVR